MEVKEQPQEVKKEPQQSEQAQLKQLKLNVTNIKSILIKKNQNTKKSDKKEDDQEKKKLSVKKKKEEEKKLTAGASSLKKMASSVKGALAKPGGSLFDKIMDFGLIVMTGILANALPAIKEKLENIFTVVGKFIEPVVDTIQILINAVSGTDGKVSPELEEKQIKFRQNIETAKDNLLDAIKSKLGPFGGIIDALKPLIDNLTSKFGAKLRLQTAGATLTKNEAGEEGITTAEGNFVRADFSADQRRRYDKGDRKAYVMPPDMPQGYTEEDASASAAAASAIARGSDSNFTDSPDLKTAIRRAESGNNYGATFRGYLDGFSRKNEDITNMSINQVVQYQKDYLAHQRKLGIPETKRSAAVGAYQMLYPEVAASKTGVPLTAKFNKENQDRMADYYLNMAGYQQFIKGKISAEQFNNRLAGQFASLKTTSGSGVYDADGINKAYEDLLDLIKKSRPAEPRASIQPIQNREVVSAISQSSDDEEGLLVAIQPIYVIS